MPQVYLRIKKIFILQAWKYKDVFLAHNYYSEEIELSEWKFLFLYYDLQHRMTKAEILYIV